MLRLKFKNDKVSEPQRPMIVPQGTFGYISKEVASKLGFDAIETFALAHCIGMVLADTVNERITLAHIDAATSEDLGAIKQKFPDCQFSDAILVVSRDSHKPSEFDLLYPASHIVTNIMYFISENTQKHHIIFQSNLDESSARIGVTLDGEVYKPEPVMFDVYFPTHLRLRDLSLAFRNKDVANLMNMNEIYEGLLRQKITV